MWSDYFIAFDTWLAIKIFPMKCSTFFDVYSHNFKKKYITTFYFLYEQNWLEYFLSKCFWWDSSPNWQNTYATNVSHTSVPHFHNTFVRRVLKAYTLMCRYKMHFSVHYITVYYPQVDINCKTMHSNHVTPDSLYRIKCTHMGVRKNIYSSLRKTSSKIN